jgi:NitT/TauT family transport system ATP-binding protein
MSGALPLAAIPPQAIPSEPDSLLTLRAAPKTHVTVRGLSKSFVGKPLYTNFNLDLPRSKIVSIFGPNGCGKSTLMNIIAGLVPLDAGEILFDGKSLKDTKIGYVFQNYRDALFPWITAWDNIAYPLRRGGMKEADVCIRVQALIKLFEIRFDLQRYPYELSGGQMQTVCIMRSMATEPEVLFLDEPFSALDFEMTLFIAPAAGGAHGHRHDHGDRLARPRGCGVPGRPHLAVDASAHAHRRAGELRDAASAAARGGGRPRVRARQGAHAGGVPARDECLR